MFERLPTAVPKPIRSFFTKFFWEISSLRAIPFS
nr:MAG TPA: hypothetical protein [Caudoviricetes sp.]